MRGILLLALGAGLIWLGLSTAPKSAATQGAPPGESRSQEPDTPQSADGFGVFGGAESLVGPARPASSGFEDLPDDAAAGPGLESGLEPELEFGGGADPGSVGVPLMVGERAQDAPAETAGHADQSPGPVLAPPTEILQPAPDEHAPGREQGLEWRAGAVRLDPAQEQDSGMPPFHLGQPTSNPVGLAVLLLESWIAGDPQALEQRLNDTEVPVPLNRRRLVYGFWQGVSRDPAFAAAEAQALREEPEGLTAAQLELLLAAGNGQADRSVPATSGHRDPLARAMRIVLLDMRATSAGERGDHPLAARSCSALIQLELAAPWAPHRSTLLHWAQALNAAQAHHRLHKDGQWPALEHTVQPNESLSIIRQMILRREPDLLLCEGLIRTVNNVGKYIHPGDLLRIPTEAPNVVVDLDARLAVYRHGTEAVMAWEVGIGKQGSETPPGIYTVGIKQSRPTHWVKGGEVPYGHPDNPLGTHWIEWVQDGKGTHLGFHGTREPEGVGGRVSLGCIRMRNADVQVLFDLLPVGARIEVRP